LQADDVATAPVMPHEETSAAVASILANLAKPYTPLEDHSFPASAIANGIKSARISLPGENTVEKQTLERELTALASRIHFLEARAASGTNSLPITPNEPLNSPFPHIDTPITPRSVGNTPRQRSVSWVNTILGRGDGESHPRQLTEEQFAYLRDMFEQQETEIRAQKGVIDDIKSQMEQQQTATKQALETLGNSPSIDQMKREIDKNSQINATYQKVLKDIGTIITAVANGDLSKKVLIHATEKDPEIARFKQTINRMIDQLQEFASQVTFLAREVGTEGRLGGQAKVPGVDGIWAELTNNGMSITSQWCGAHC
jgi:osomolarity two-component system sensor histidine kinase NIK1